eukprot:ctg_1316.g488
MPTGVSLLRRAGQGGARLATHLSYPAATSPVPQQAVQVPGAPDRTRGGRLAVGGAETARLGHGAVGRTVARGQWRGAVRGECRPHRSGASGGGPGGRHGIRLRTDAAAIRGWRGGRPPGFAGVHLHRDADAGRDALSVP